MEESTIDQIISWIGTKGLFAAAVLVGARISMTFVHALVTRIVREAIKPDNFADANEERQREDTLIGIISTTLKVLIWIVAGMIILEELGVEIAPLLAGAGVAGLAVGFGAQSLVKDFVSGLFIVMENHYRVGDVVELAGVSGVVESITMRATVLRDLDGNVHNIPNGAIKVATNKTMEFSRINMEVGVSYEANIDKVEKIINKVGKSITEDDEWAEKIEESLKFLRIESFGDSSVNVKILGTVKPGAQWSVAGEFRKRLKEAFDKEKIDIPYPQCAVHLTKK